ncbi:MAG: penicillin-binding protein 2, partial [Lactobacillaceae bacterium]|nr:penicillin-binding protein 2 [Lactobacillaceae bacterium]
MKNYKEYRQKDDVNQVTNDQVLPVRLNIIFYVSFVLMTLLIIKLTILTIFDGNTYFQTVNRTDTVTQKIAVPRGTIYDSAGKIVVGNTPTASIMYTRPTGVTSEEMAKEAKKLAGYISISTKKLTQRQQIDYYLANPKNYQKSLNSLNLSNSEINQLSNSEIYQKTVDKLTKDKLSLSKKNKKAAFIFYRMNQVNTLASGVIKESNVSNEEIAKVGERASELGGLGVSQNWLRSKPDDDSLAAIVGSVSSPLTGLPDSQAKKLRAYGYENNASVGLNGLEEQYQLELAGTPKTIQVDTNSSKTINSGQNGQDLHLTINSDFQSQVQEILKNHMAEGLSTGAYATVINPETGAIYAMGGWSRDNKSGEVKANPLGNLNVPILMGSVVKPATEALGLQQGVITTTENTLIDQTIQIQGSPAIKSAFNENGDEVPLTARQALEVSSNTYMIQLALKINKTPYYNGMTIPVAQNTWSIMRNGYEQFGLGIRTGIDLPGETSGSKIQLTNSNYAQFISLSYGQFDAYTTLQLA